MNKFKQGVKSLLSDIKYCFQNNIVFIVCSLTIILVLGLKLLSCFDLITWNEGYVFIDIMLTYGIATFIIGWVGFRVYQVYNK